ncbi:MAG: formylglycine-generating enzyme family protein [Planctomycetota bacterium]|jgi:formylglycine-generating enzyme required for sulfatase activity
MGIEFIELKPGYFLMGSEVYETERPRRWVEIGYSFWIAKTEVTNEQYQQFDPQHQPSELSPGATHPVVAVPWTKADQFCRWLSGHTPFECHLPAEAEWEYACRAGSQTAFCFGNDTTRLSAFAWFAANSDCRLHRVATRKPNAWGFFDMHGNATEWCKGDKKPSEILADSNPQRGGGCYDLPEFCRSAYRFDHGRLAVGWYLGFRPAMRVN